MPIDTVNVRFPRRLHTQAKIGAAQHQMSLQAFLEYAVQKLEGLEEVRTSRTALMVNELTEDHQAVVREVIKFLQVAPLRYVNDLRAYLKAIIRLAKAGVS